MIDVSQSGHYVGDCRELLRQLPDACVQTCVTSPPYWGLRDYGVDGQLGLEATPEEYVANMVEVFRDVRRVLRDDGTLWLNIGDSYAGSGKGPSNDKPHRNMSNTAAAPKRWLSLPDGIKAKDLVGIPWEVAFALRADGWYLRCDIIWAKVNPMPESVTDRPMRAHEYLFLLSKSERYHYDVDAIRVPQKTLGERHEGASGYRADHPSKTTRTANKRSLHPLGKNRNTIWTTASQPYDGAHFATFPPALIEPCVLAGARVGDIVLDPFFGSGTTGAVAEKHGRRWIGFDLNPAYEALQKERTAQRSLVLGGEK